MEATYTRKHPFLAKIKKRTLLSPEGSTRRTYHIVLDLSGANIHYKVGDAIGILPINPPDLIEELLEALGKSGEEEIIDPRSQKRLLFRHFLSHQVDLMRTPRALLKFLADRVQRNAIRLAHEGDLAAFFSHHKSQGIQLSELIRYFSPLLPRFYSIASSQAVVKQEVHLLVATFNYTLGEKVRQGVGSQFLCQNARINETPIPMYIQSTSHFTLPADSEMPILMIGPGTGVAPYRGFLQERYHQRAKGKNWLIFGERHRAFDYYYEPFFRKLEKENFLRIDTAFSRDQSKKVYVQHRLFENSSKVWQWLQDGAYVYICGDKRAMGKDVTAAFYTLVQKEGGLTEVEAKEYVKQLRREKRFLLDVY